MERIFLLGGHDLEMLEIRHLLESHHIRFEDKGLGWSNALLSAYADVIALSPEADFYGIELQEDYPLPKHYTRIDHHNDYNDRPSSLLQVAHLLGVEPDRHLQLIAANDAGYIPAMQALGATDAEIADIRRQDRASQGVTEEDEHYAELSVSEHMTKHGGLIVIHALTNRFSAICDRIFPYKQLLIYTDTEWIYYGEGKNDLVKQLAAEIDKKNVFFGGDVNGYVGAVKNRYDKKEINQFVHHIIIEYGNL